MGSRATVYRALEHLVRLGLARRVHHDGSAARFDGNAERHHHLICRRCASITDLARELIDAFPMPRVGSAGFEVHDFSVNFEGLCRACAAERPAGESGRPNTNEELER